VSRRGVVLVLATVALGLGVAGSVALARYNPVDSTRTCTSVGTLFKSHEVCQTDHYFTGTPHWAVVGAYAAPSVGGGIFGLTVLLIVVVPLARRVSARWQGRRRERLTLPRRIFLVTLVLGLGTAGAVAISTQPQWGTPVGVLIGFLGLGAAAGLVFWRAA
jgi:hypothetical protein